MQAERDLVVAVVPARHGEGEVVEDALAEAVPDGEAMRRREIDARLPLRLISGAPIALGFDQLHYWAPFFSVIASEARQSRANGTRSAEIASSLGFSQSPSSGGGRSGEIIVDGARQPVREPLLIGALLQQSLVPGIGEAPELHQRGGHVGGGQHRKSRRAMRPVQQQHGAAKLLDYRPRQNQRRIVGLPARQVEEDRADLARLTATGEPLR